MLLQKLQLNLQDGQRNKPSFLQKFLTILDGNYSKSEQELLTSAIQRGDYQEINTAIETISKRQEVNFYSQELQFLEKTLNDETLSSFVKEINQIKIHSFREKLKELNPTDEGKIDKNESIALNLIQELGILNENRRCELVECAKQGNESTIESVKKLQTSLKEDGKYNGEIDGIAGELTKNGIQQIIQENFSALLESVEIDSKNYNNFFSPQPDEIILKR